MTAAIAEYVPTIERTPLEDGVNSTFSRYTLKRDLDDGGSFTIIAEKRNIFEPRYSAWAFELSSKGATSMVKLPSTNQVVYEMLENAYI